MNDFSAWKDKIISGEATVSLLQKYIEYNSLDDFLNLLKTIDIFELGEEKADETSEVDIYIGDVFLDMLLNMCKDNNRDIFVKPIIDAWDKHNIIYYLEPTFIRLFMYQYFSLSLLGFVVRSISAEWSYNDVLRQLIQMDSSPSVEFAAYRATTIYGLQSYHDYVNLSQWADSEIENDGWGNDRINWFIQDMIRKTKPFSKGPKYIITSDKNPYGGNFRIMIDKLPDTYNVIPSDISQTDLIGASTHNISIKNMESYYQVSDSLRYRYLVNPKDFDTFKIKRARQSASLDAIINMEVFRILGPAHTYIVSKLDENHPCDRFGGCRMLVCDQFEVRPFDSVEEQEEMYDIMSDYDYTYNPNDAPNKKLREKAILRKYTGNWFTGSCYYCMSKIKKLEYAVREPLVDGGWRRCYCRWSCVKKKLLSDPESKERDIQYYLTVNFEIACSHVGIYERIK